MEGLLSVYRLALPPGTQHGARLTVARAGFPNPATGQRGALHAVVSLLVPRQLSAAQAAALRAYQQLAP